MFFHHIIFLFVASLLYSLAMENTNINLTFSESDEATTPESSRTKKSSQGKQCAAFGCYSRQFNLDKSATGISFFRFPQTNPEKSVWCNLIKRQDGRDNFIVNEFTFICEKHFKDGDIKKNPCRWKLIKGAKPCLNIYQHNLSSEKKPPSRKPPTPRQNPPAKKRIK